VQTFKAGSPNVLSEGLELLHNRSRAGHLM